MKEDRGQKVQVEIFLFEGCVPRDQITEYVANLNSVYQDEL